MDYYAYWRRTAQMLVIDTTTPAKRFDAIIGERSKELREMHMNVDTRLSLLQ
jgi:hypothetical protein